MIRIFTIVGFFGFSIQASGIVTPVSQAKDIVFSNYTASQVELTWTRGDGDRCAVFVKNTTSGSPTPVDNVNYTANSVFGTAGTQIGTTGWYCVYNGTETSAVVTGLIAVKQYQFMVCEYNYASPTDIKYNKTSSTGNSRNFTIKNTQTITFNPLADKVFGTADFSPGATSGSGLTVTYISSDIAVADIVSGKIRIKGVGTCTITANQNGNGSYYQAENVSQSFTVIKANQTITNFNPPAVKTYGNSQYTISAKPGTSGVPVEFTSSDPSVLSISGNTVTIVGAGTAKIIASQAGNFNYNPSPDVEKTVTVNKAAQTITFAAITKKYGDPPFELTATGGASGNPIVYNSSDPTVAIISGNTVTILKASSSGINITASQEGNSNYLAATSVSRKLTVNQATQTIVFDDIPTKTFGDVPFNVTATGGASMLPVTFTSSNTNIATVSGNIITIKAAGTVTITAKQAGNTNYKAAPDVAKTLIINKASQTISFNPLPTKNIGDPEFNPGATTSSGLAISYYESTNTAVAKYFSGKIYIVGAGKTTIRAIQNGNNNFEPAPVVEQELTVYMTGQTITFNPIPDKTFGDDDFYPPANATSGLPVRFTTSDPALATIVNNKIHITGAGTVNITAHQDGNSSYQPAPVVVQPLIIKKADQTLSLIDTVRTTFGADDFDPGGVSSSGLMLEYTCDNSAIATIVNGKLHITGAGIANINASQPGNQNYNSASTISRILKVTKAPQNIYFGDVLNHYFNDPDFSPEATASSGLPVEYSSSNTSVATIVNNKIHITGVGVVTITAKQLGNNNYLAAPDISKSFQVNKASQNIIFNSLSPKTYGDADFSLDVISTSGLPIDLVSENNSLATISGNTVHIKGAGTVNIIANVAGNSFYMQGSTVKQQLVINKANQFVTFNAIPEKTMGDPDFNPGAAASSGLDVLYLSDNTNVAIIVNNQVRIVGAGTATIFALQYGNSFYNPAIATSRILTVSKGSQTISFPPIPSKTYNDSEFSPGAVSTSNQPIEYKSDDEKVAVIMDNRVYIVGIGTAKITAIQSGNQNYLPASPVSQLLVVKKASQSITFNVLPEKVYGDPDFSPVAWTTSGLNVVFSSSDNSVATIVKNKVHIIGAGSVTIYANQAGNEFYNPALQRAQILTIAKADQIITFNPLPPVNSQCPDFVLEVISSSGLPVSFNGDNNFVATVKSGVVHINGAGKVTITASQQGNNNYKPAANVIQVLQVVKQSQIIVFDTIPIKTYGDPDFKPEVITSSGLEVVLSSDNPKVATIKNGLIHIVGAGKATITASQPGNQNYEGAESSVKKILQVNKALITAKAEKFQRQFQQPNPNFKTTYSGFVLNESESVIDNLPIITTTATQSSNPGLYELIPSGGKDDNYEFLYEKGTLIIMGTYPLKPFKPTGNEVLCLNPANQTYTTMGSMFATSYTWSVAPASAAKFVQNGKSVTIDIDNQYLGQIAVSVKGLNSYGFSETSDTLYIHVLTMPQNSIIQTNGSYCSNVVLGDSIHIINSQPFYRYQLINNQNTVAAILTGTGSKIGWGNIFKGTYRIEEQICKIATAQNIQIKEVDPTTNKPEIQVKWNDVLVCINSGDTVRKYQWFRNGEILSGENKQYLWTQKTPGNYTVKTIDKNHCEYYSDEKTIDPQTTGLIYPNPNNGQFKLSFSNKETGKVTIKIKALNGLSVKTLGFVKDLESFEKDIDIPDLKTGVYFIDVTMNNNRVFYEKLIKD